MLFYPIPQSFGCASYVAKITLAQKFINNRTLLGGRNAILFGIDGGALLVLYTIRRLTAKKAKKHFVMACLI